MHLRFIFSLTLLVHSVTYPGQALVNQTVYEDIKGRSIDIRNPPGKMTLMLHFNALNLQTKSLLSYAQVLSNLYQQQGFRVVSSISDKRSRLLDFIGKSRITFPVTQKSFAQLSRECRNCDGFILLNEKGEVVFENFANFDKEILRQLVENGLKGNIDYFQKPVTNDTFKLYNSFPEIKLYRLKDHKNIDLADYSDSNIVMTFFSSLCSQCKSGKRISTLKDFARLAQRSDLSVRVILAFVEPMDIEDIASWERKNPIPFDKCLSSEVFSDLEKYRTSDNAKTDPLTVMLDHRRRIVYVERPGEKEEEIVKALEKAISNDGIIDEP